MDVFTVSVAVTLCSPAVFRVTPKVFVPLSAARKVWSEGSTATGSVEVKVIVPV